MTSDFDRYFRDYAELYNRALTDKPDYQGITERFSTCFIAAGPQGVKCGENGKDFLASLEEGYAFYKKIGTRRMNVRRCEVSKIDDTHHMVKVFYSADFEKDGRPLSIDFDVTYLLDSGGSGEPKIFAFIAGDETALYRQHGLIA